MPTAPPDPTYIPQTDEIASTLEARGIAATVDERGRLVLADDTAALAVLRLSEQRLQAYRNASYMPVELWHPQLRIAEANVVLTREQAWDWFKAKAKDSPYYEEGCWFVLDQGPIRDGDEDGPRLRSKYTVEDGQVISRGWE